MSSVTEYNIHLLPSVSKRKPKTLKLWKRTMAGKAPFAQALLRFRCGRLRSGQETKNFIHHAVGQVRLKKKLRMSIAV
jgi:hypothetical protein